ncbi:MAG: PaaI family thioesterase [Acidimicrobiales bacterium]
MTDTGPRIYPPQGHLIRHLRMELHLRSEDEMHTLMPVSDDLRDDGGALRFGAMAATIDVAAGTFSHEMVRPDWLATTDMKVHLQRPTRADRVEMVTTTVRAGGRNIVSQTLVSDDEGEVARSWVTYARLPRRDDSPAIESGSRVGRRLHYVEDEETEREPLDDYLRIRLHPSRLALDLDHHHRIHNSFGSLQGGAAAVLIERVAMLAVERQLGLPGRVTDLHLYYLGQTREGPFRVEGTVLRRDEGSITTEVAIYDAGNGDRILDLGTATAVPIRGEPGK